MVENVDVAVYGGGKIRWADVEVFGFLDPPWASSRPVVEQAFVQDVMGFEGGGVFQRGVCRYPELWLDALT